MILSIPRRKTAHAQGPARVGIFGVLNDTTAEQTSTHHATTGDRDRGMPSVRACGKPSAAEGRPAVIPCIGVISNHDRPPGTPSAYHTCRVFSRTHSSIGPVR